MSRLRQRRCLVREDPLTVRVAEVQAGTTPIISLAISPDGARVAAAGIGGTVNLIDRRTHSLASALVGPGLPVWSVAFMPDGATLLTGGADAVVRSWNAQTGNPVGAPQQGSPPARASSCTARTACTWWRELPS